MRKTEPAQMKCASMVRRPHGLSLPEVIVVLAILATLLALAIPQFKGMFGASQDVLARNFIETLNSAVHRYGQGNGELIFTSMAASGTDEMQMLRALQWRHPENPKPGSPYMRPDWNPDTTSDTAYYRIQWNGSLFALLPPGSPGLGIKLMFDGSDITTPFVFPPGYNPGGK